MGNSQQDLGREEYLALRATIRERGSLRLVLFMTTLSIWGALAVATAAALALPAAALIPLTVLAAGFEAVAALHIGVERIGRYVQVRFEAADTSPAPLPQVWERTAMAWGRRFPGTGSDPLFSAMFLLATIVNYLPVALTGVLAELVALAVAHTLFVWRIVHVRGRVARQRAEDLERFELLLSRQPSQAAHMR